MRTSVIDVRDMLSVLSVPGVEERIGEVPGVESVTVNFAGGSATVRYDESRLDIAGIRSGVRQNAYDSDDAPAAHSAEAGHEGHSTSGSRAAMSAQGAPKKPPDASAKTGAGNPDIAQREVAAPKAAPAPTSADLKAATTAPTPAAATPVSTGKSDKSATGKE